MECQERLCCNDRVRSFWSESGTLARFENGGGHLGLTAACSESIAGGWAEREQEVPPFSRRSLLFAKGASFLKKEAPFGRRRPGVFLAVSLEGHPLTSFSKF